MSVLIYYVSLSSLSGMVMRFLMHQQIGEAAQVEIHGVDPWIVDLSVQDEVQHQSHGVPEEHQNHCSHLRTGLTGSGHFFQPH